MLFRIVVLRMKNLAIFFVFVAVLFHSGCGIVSLLGTPSRSERKIPAEYDLAEHADQKILVLVNQPAWLSAQVNLRYYLTGAINKNLTTKVGMQPDYLVPYSELSEFRSNRPDFSLLSPVQVGEALHTDMVLLVIIENYQLHEVAETETDYHKGVLDVRAALVETATGEMLWPDSTESKSIKVGFEVESRGREAGVARLAGGCAHCIVRYLYNCPKKQFNISDDRSGIGWKSWRE